MSIALFANGLLFEFTWGAVIPVVLLTAIAIAQLGLVPGLIGAGLLVFSLVAHECGHLLAAVFFRVPIKALGFCWAGAFTRREPSGRHHAELLIALAGPLTSLLLMCICLPLGEIGLWLAKMNCFIALTNLVPLSGSDGRRAYTALKGLFAVKTQLRPSSSLLQTERPAA